MKMQKVLAIATAVACVVTIAPWVITFGRQPLSLTPADWGVFGDYIGGTLSGPLAFAGFIALLITIQQQRAFAQDEQNKSNDLKYFESAQQCLKRAYETIKPIPAVNSPPKNRTAWLTTARWLLAATTIASKISDTSPSLKEAFELEVEHYRLLFFGHLKPNQMDSVFSEEEFFVGDCSGSEIEERSVRVILEFMEWPEEKNDALRNVLPYTLEEVESMYPWLHGFQAYLLKKPRFKQDS